MAGILVPGSRHTTITAANTGIVTVTSTTDVWPGMIGHISAGGQTSRRIRVLSVPSATTFRAKFEDKIDDSTYRSNPTNSVAASDLSVYNGGTVDFESGQVAGTNSTGAKFTG